MIRSRITLSVFAFIAGGMTSYALASLGIIQTLPLDMVPRDTVISSGVAFLLLVLVWAVVFVRPRAKLKARGHDNSATRKFDPY